MAVLTSDLAGLTTCPFEVGASLAQTPVIAALIADGRHAP
jgi:hypothetical protein